MEGLGPLCKSKASPMGQQLQGLGVAAGMGRAQVASSSAWGPGMQVVQLDAGPCCAAAQQLQAVLLCTRGCSGGQPPGLGRTWGLLLEWRWVPVGQSRAAGEAGLSWDRQTRVLHCQAAAGEWRGRCCGPAAAEAMCLQPLCHTVGWGMTT